MTVYRLNSVDDINASLKVCGYGLPSELDALKSTDRRVTMVYQGSIAIDHFNVFEVPIPDVFRQARGERRIIVTLAYDPPVRRRLLVYLGVVMEYFLIRGQSLEQVHSAFTSRYSGYGQCRNRMSVDIKSTLRKASTLQRGEIVMRRPEAESNNYGNEYYLVVRCERKWAPSDIITQDIGLTVSICADDPQLYNKVALQVRQRELARARARTR